MEKIIAVLLEITMYSAILLIGILAFQKIFARHISARFKYGIWFLLLLRFIVPITIETNVQLTPIVPDMQGIIVDIETENDAAKNEDAYNNDENVAFTGEDQKRNRQEGRPATKVSPKAWMQANASLMVFSLWIAGCLLSVLRLCFRHYKFNTYIKHNAIKADAALEKAFEMQKDKLNISSKIHFYTINGISSPGLIASFKPKILMPEEISANMLQFGVMHELTHYKRRDHWMIILLHLLTCLYWFNPTIWIMKQHMLADMEFACDEQVAMQLTKKQRKAYARTLIGLPVDGNYKKLAVGMRGATRKNAIEKRIRSIMTNKKTKHFAYVSLLLLIMLMAMLCFTTACKSTSAQGAEPEQSGVTAPSEEPIPNDENTQMIDAGYPSEEMQARFDAAEKQKPQAMEAALVYVAQKFPEKEVVAYYTDAIQVIYDDNGEETDSMLLDCYIAFDDETAIYIGIEVPGFSVDREWECTDDFLSTGLLKEYSSYPDAEFMGPVMDKR